MKALRKRKLNSKGFSLVEVLVTLAIVGVIATLIASIITQGSRFYRKESKTISLQNDLMECSNKVVDVLMGANSIDCVEDSTKLVLTVTRAKMSPETRIIYWKKPAGTEEVGSLYVFDNSVPPESNTDDWEGCCLSSAVKELSIVIDDISHPEKTDADGNLFKDSDHVTQPVIFNISVKVSDGKESKSDSKTITLRNRLTSLTYNGHEMVE